MLVQALVAGSLDATIDPQSLFDIPLSDEYAVEREALGIRALARSIDEATQPSATAAPDTKPAEAAIPPIDFARLALDRARLEFYSLSPTQRDALLEAHARVLATPRATVADPEQQRLQADAERTRALEEAQIARAEADRMVQAEKARLNALGSTLASVRDGFRIQREEIAGRTDVVLGWQRRVREAEMATPADADALYLALRRSLRAARDETQQALDVLGSSDSRVPEIGNDPLLTIPPDIAIEEVTALRAQLTAAVQDAKREERELRERRASMLLDEIGALNRERLGLLAFLSPEGHAEITGFGSAGWDQAKSEVRHLGLILRYHRYVTGEWLRSPRAKGALEKLSLWELSALSAKLTFSLLVFLWWWRRSPGFIAQAEQHLAEIDRLERRTSVSRARRAIQYLSAIHRPLEWLLLLAVMLWLLPATARSLLEVQLLSVIVGWTMGGALIVNVINAIATDSAGARYAYHQKRDTAQLRLRSLRLVGRIIVGFILVLVLTARLVGKGTIYNWALSTCWIAAIPVFMILIRWWRQTVFERIGRQRRHTPLQLWVLANRSGWKSFFAAMIAAIDLFTSGVLRSLRNWLADFNIARRMHAYLFKRELDRIASEKQARVARPLGMKAYADLSPDRAGADWVPCPADEYAALVRQKAACSAGGVVAIVGGRGIGKSSLLRRIQHETPGSLMLVCTHETTVATLQGVLEQAAGVPPVFLLDAVGTLINPVRGGLAMFDQMLEFARSRSSGTLWLFAIDEVLWPFLRRSRDSRPMFDEVLRLQPWTDEQIGELLLQRCSTAGIEPTYEDLLEQLSLVADEFDREESLNAKRAGYNRMIWDYTGGSPGMALEVWRSSLVEDYSGKVRVRPLQAPDPAHLDTLPDSALFILRAVMQLAPATVAEVARSTRLTEAQVHNAFLYGEAHGFLTIHETRAQISWSWLRPVIKLLVRRRLLVNV